MSGTAWGMIKHFSIISGCWLAMAVAGLAGEAQASVKHQMPVPTAEQFAWQKMGVIAFAHFGINTFTDREWGDGKEDPQLFNPEQLDASQWVTALKAAGVKLLILTAKHHDGFCLWPSKYTSHSVKNSAWKGGQGDVVREVSAACKKGGLKFGVYLSPWDRHEKTYGDSPAYNEHFRNQLTELLTQYGPVAEVWFDGACGEGPNGKKQEYDWASFFKVVRRCQPGALIAICGPDIRWVGNETGVARENESSVQKPNPQMHPPVDYVWYPAECDVSIRPGWFFHGVENERVKSLDQLLGIYYQSVGRNSVLLLNVPPDRRGLIHENDTRRLAEFGAEIKRRFAKPLAKTSGRGSLVRLPLRRTARIDHVLISEDIRYGERVKEYVVEGQIKGQWMPLCRGKVVGSLQVQRIAPAEVEAVRLRCLQCEMQPVISRLAVCAVDK